MILGKVIDTRSFEDQAKDIDEISTIYQVLGIKKIPCVICSPLRKDSHPSFGIYSKDGIKIRWFDFATKEGGGLYELLSQLWFCNKYEVLIKLNNKRVKSYRVEKTKPPVICNTSKSIINCKVREWTAYDEEYWKSFGVTLEWLNYADVYPISHIIINKNDTVYTIGADKYAYAYVEKKENNTTLKIYQPFNTNGHKWSNNHNRSVISLWTKVPKEGDTIVICSSLKDALCLWSNTGIPAIATQGEGYEISNTAINELKKRFKWVFILFDNDLAGLLDGEKLSKSTGFINIVLPYFDKGKDVSDYYKSLEDKSIFKQTILNLLNHGKKRTLCKN